VAIRIGNYQLGPGAIVLALALIGGLLYVAARQFNILDKLSPQTDVSKTQIVPDARDTNIDRADLPATDIKPPRITRDDPEVTIGLWTWQATSPIIDAVGGTGKSGDHPDSLLAQAGIKNTRIVIENDTSKQIQALAAGQMQFVTTTGDQSAVDIAGANQLLRGNKAKVVWSAGYSSGEDALMGPESWKQNPQNARGALIVTAVPYCDWNVAVNWAADNKIPVNANEQVYNPDALNFVNASDHIEASQKFISNAKVSLRNTRTGQTEAREIDGVATWTPGDVTAAQGRPTVNYKGRSEKLQKIISTEQYSGMMPHILFANEDFIRQHRDYVETLLRCFARAGAKIKSDRNYFNNRVAALNSQVFAMEGKGPSFWSKYFNVTNENGVSLGGSRVNDIADNRHLFGLGNNVALAQSVFGISYNDHGKRLQQLLPERLPKITPVEQVVDVSFVKAMSDEVGQIVAETYGQNQNGAAPNTGTVVEANFNINFDAGSANIKSSEIPKLNEIRSLLIRASNTRVIVEGHSDNTGGDAQNIPLSKARAEAVWTWLKASDTSRVNINDQRLTGVDGYGAFRPVAGTREQQTDADRAQNRRVTIILK
jgi:outer membrane protein OmpA-like peptidoglycan-associated protein/ABC-type nitrate/sulfonate/bicarbonate transport system substrate-binding protein